MIESSSPNSETFTPSIGITDPELTTLPTLQTFQPSTTQTSTIIPTSAIIVSNEISKPIKKTFVPTSVPDEDETSFPTGVPSTLKNGDDKTDIDNETNIPTNFLSIEQTNERVIMYQAQQAQSSACSAVIAGR